MRIISGKHKGRRIEMAKEASGVRPTSDFARQAIFNILTHGKHAPEGGVEGRAVLDVFCGTGALGLEALSRGAGSVTFVDSAREALSMARANAEKMGELAAVDFVLSDATKLPRARAAFSLVFMDPPYHSGLAVRALAALQAGGWLTDDVLIIIEHDVKETLALPEGFVCVDERRYGRAVIALVQRSGKN